MTGNAALRIGGRPLPDGPAAFTTPGRTPLDRKAHRELDQVRPLKAEQELDRRHGGGRLRASTIFCLVRWAANEYGTIISRLDIVRAVDRGEPFERCPSCVLAAKSLLKVELAEGRGRASSRRRHRGPRHRSRRC